MQRVCLPNTSPLRIYAAQKGKRPDRSESHDGPEAVCVCVSECHLTSVWQDEECNTMKVIMHLGHVSLSRGMGAERQSGWRSGETSSVGEILVFVQLRKCLKSSRPERAGLTLMELIFN